MLRSLNDLAKEDCIDNDANKDETDKGFESRHVSCSDGRSGPRTALDCAEHGRKEGKIVM